MRVCIRPISFLLAVSSSFHSASSFTTPRPSYITPRISAGDRGYGSVLPMKNDSNNGDGNMNNSFLSGALSFLLSASLVLSPISTQTTLSGLPLDLSVANADTEKNYDGFADYAKDNKMEQSDVGCFINKCGDQTKALFSNPRGIKGVSCLGR